MQSFQDLYSVDHYAQFAIFQNWLESNLTTLPKDKVFPITLSTAVQIFKNI
jgi:hypothetical protein